MIVCFDPGYTTGVAVIGNFRAVPAPDLIDFDVIAAFDMPWADRVRATRDIITNNAPAIRAIVCERFYLFHHEDALKKQIGSEMPSARVIGVIEAEADRAGIFERLEFQETWQRKQARVLPKHMNEIGASRHTFDAYCHARYYARTHWRALTMGQ